MDQVHEPKRFLGVDGAVARPYLDRLVGEELLSRGPDGRYVLTEQGLGYGAHAFAQEFADLTHPARGECGPDCWCHASHDEAVVCGQERRGPTARGR